MYYQSSKENSDCIKVTTPISVSWKGRER